MEKDGWVVYCAIENEPLDEVAEKLQVDVHDLVAQNHKRYGIHNLTREVPCRKALVLRIPRKSNRYGAPRILYPPPFFSEWRKTWI